MSVNGTSTMSDQSCVPEKRFSRVSCLRDMFQNGVVRPIEEIDNFEAYVSPPPFSHMDDPTRFLRSLPGSPPLSALRNHRLSYTIEGTDKSLPDSPPFSALRNHRLSYTKEGTDNSNSAKYNPGGVLSHTNGNGTDALSAHSTQYTVPPARPPKPRHLVLDKVSPSKSPPAPVKTKISSELRKSIALFENGARNSFQNGVDKAEKSELNSSIRATAVAVQDTSNEPTIRRRSITAIEPRDQDTPQPVGDQTPTTNIQSSQPCPAKSENDSVPSEAFQPDATQIETTSPQCPNERGDKLEHICDNLTELDVSSTQPRLSSWQATTDLDRIETSAGESSALQDFILQSDAFRVSPHFLNSTTNIEDSLPTLQHAEPIAVATPDEDDESDLEHSGLMYAVEDAGVVKVLPVADCDASGAAADPTLPVPPGLKVVAVDFQGVHILEDGNFFYSVPGLSSRPNSPEDSDFLSTRPHRPFIASGDSAESHETATFSELSSAMSDSVHATDLSLRDNSTDSIGREPRVRFSTEPIVIYSTHSTSEYNRRNDEIDPLAASAEYELEKHLEEMELHVVELKKGPQGLGISILGLGVDNVGGDQKLGIFIKALTPGGAAEADGRIQVFDQIVEVDGQNLVGVSQRFAAQTLRNTRDIVHFVLAREQDPSNSRVAQLLAEQQEEERYMNSVMNRSDTQTEETKQPISISRDDSVETLHRLMADAAETAARAMAESWSDNEADDAVDEDELVIDEESLFDPSNTASNERVIDLSSTPAVNSTTDGNALPGLASPRSALKGTATAASTKRRQDAIAQIIQAAANRSKSSSSPSEDSSLAATTPTAPNPAPATTNSPSPSDAPVDGVTWLLASDLYDCHNQLSKLQSQMQVLEQRLTAQEAAADEAIERLCLQCRHVELELNEARQRLQAYLQTHQNGGDDGLSNRTAGENSQHAHTNSKPTVTINGSVNSPICSTPSSIPAPYTMDSLQTSDLGTELANLAVQALDSNLSAVTYEDGWITGTSKPTFDLGSPCVKNGSAMPQLDTSPTQPDGPVSPDSQTNPWRGIQERLRLTTTGGLAHRRPPTQIVIAPPLALPPGMELNMVYSTDDSRSSNRNRSDNRTVSPQVVTKLTGRSPCTPELIIHSGSSTPHAATPAFDSPRSDSHTGSVRSEQTLLMEAQPLLTFDSPNSPSHCGSAVSDSSPSPSLAKHKKLGVELPGLSEANHVILRHRDKPTSTVSTIATSGLSAAEVRRQANAVLLSSLKGLSQSP